MSTRTFTFTVQSQSLPSWVPSIGSWGVASTNTLASQDPGTADPVRSIAGVFAYCGGVYASDYSQHGALVVGGGGHNDYYGNELYAFNLTTGAWSRCGTTYPTVPGTPSNSDGELAGSVNGSRPGPCHTYNCLQYIPGSDIGNTKGIVLRPNAASLAQASGGFGSGRSHQFDLDSNLWSRFYSAVSPATTNYAGATAYDTARKVLWWVPQGTQSPRKLTLAGTWTTSGVTAFETNYTAAAVYVPTVDRIFVFDPRFAPFTVRAINPATDEVSSSTPSGGPAAQGADIAGLGAAWCADLGKILVYPYYSSAGVTNRGTIYTFDPVSLTWATLVTSSAVDACYGGVNGRFQYAPAAKCAIVAPTVTGNVFAYRVA